MNKAILIGNLAADPEVKTTTGGNRVCRFQVAVNRDYKDRSGKRPVDYFTVIAWRELGDLCGKYLSKGRKVAVEAKIQTRSYDAQDGTKRYVTEFVADNIEFLTPRDSARQAPAASDAAPPPPEPNDNGGGDLDDDELPF